MIREKGQIIKGYLVWIASPTANCRRFAMTAFSIIHSRTFADLFYPCHLW
ncbi:MAG: hypothetical protein LBT00_11650 [Spirochaetaceae bacterium]|nr:hypothetical protein [Spirochaetaceae bacterium]